MADVTRWGEIQELLPPLLPVGAGGVHQIIDPVTGQTLIQTTATAGLETILTGLLNQSQPFTLAWVGQGKYTDGWFLAGLADNAGATYTYFDVHLGTLNPGHVNGFVNPSGGPANDLRHQSAKLRTYMFWRNGTNASCKAGYKTQVDMTGIGAAANANGRLGLGDIIGTYATVKHRAVRIIMGRAGDPADISATLRWARTYHKSVSGADSTICGEGDSITQGFQGSGVNDNSWITILSDTISQFADYDSDNYATAGAGIIAGAISARAALVDAYFAAHPATKKILSLWGGTNDVAGNADPTAAANAIWTYIDARRAATPGLKVVVWTMLARDATGPGSSVTQAVMDAGRTTLNTNIRANAAAHGAVIADIANDANFAANNSFGSAYMLADHVHPSATGQAYIATFGAGVIAPL
jgi:lysophospholipase L1-like esterase